MAGASSISSRLFMSESRPVRLACFFLYYFCQGLPVGLTAVALPAWLAANGAATADVAAIVATAYLPWSFKFVLAAVMDRYSYLPMGRRRLWLIIAQFLMMAGFLIAAIVAPGPDDVELLIYVTFMVMAGAAMQDVAVDGLAVDILPEADQGTASAVMFGGQSVGRAGAGAGAGFGLQFLGSQTTFLLFLPVIALMIVLAIVVRERPGEKRLPWSRGQASAETLAVQAQDWLAIFRITLRSMVKRDSFVLLGSAGLSRTAEGLLLPLWPILATTYLAYQTGSYSGMISTVDFSMALVAIVAGSFMTTRLGPRMASALVLMAFAALGAFILLGQDLWTIGAVFVGMSCILSLLSTLTSINSNPLRMQLSDKRVAATQFTIYNSLSNLPVSFGATLLVWLGGAEELALVMGTFIVLMLASAALMLVLRIGGAPVRAELVPRVD